MYEILQQRVHELVTVTMMITLKSGRDLSLLPPHESDNVDAHDGHITHDCLSEDAWSQRHCVF